LAASAARAQEPLRVGEIRIQSLDVFSPEEERRGWVYRLADALHVETQTAVIRRFLLFREGDAYDPERLAQTERNLRALTFLKSARVTAGEAHDGVVDVEVTTQDAWTTQLELHLGSGGGETRWAAGVTESNLLGLGKELGFLYDEDVERTNRLIEFRDPALFGAYWSGAFLYADNSDGSRRTVRVARPFASTFDRLSAEALWDKNWTQERIYGSGVVESEYTRRHQQVLASWGLAVWPGAFRARRLTAGIDFFQDDFMHLPGRPDDALPVARDYRYVFVGWEDTASDFVTTNYVDKAERVEDFNLGARYAVQAGVSPAAFGAPSTTFAVSGETSRGWRLSPAAFLRGQAAFRTRLDGGAQNATLSGALTFVWKHPTALAQTTVVRLEVDRGWRLDQDVQFFADGDHGLRGYRLYAFEGDRRIVLNVEHRIFSGTEILQLFSLGAVAFVDTGTAVPRDQPLKFSSLRTDAGLGIRVAISRAATNPILRLDCAYAFDPDPLGRRGWLVSFSSGQAF
jgi:hypothetical protein